MSTLPRLMQPGAIVMVPTAIELRLYRSSLGLSQRTAAQVIHSSERTWQDWESGRSPMHPGLWELFQTKTRGSPITQHLLEAATGVLSDAAHMNSTALRMSVSKVALNVLHVAVRGARSATSTVGMAQLQEEAHG